MDYKFINYKSLNLVKLCKFRNVKKKGCIKRPEKQKVLISKYVPRKFQISKISKLRTFEMWCLKVCFE